MEKQLATPDNYPLTVNSLMSAANQKSNREPVTNYQQGEIVRTLRELEEKRFVRYEMGARSEKYEQRFTHSHSLSRKQQALLSVMMLRGPQTIGELQTRTQRLYDFTDRSDLMVSLERLTQGDSPMVVLIPRQTGQRDDRYGHCLCGEVALPMAATTRSEPATSQNHSEIETLQQQVATLQQQLLALYKLTGHPLPNQTDEPNPPEV
jgi:uncharacterized protein YceH (UPF0502 family)